MLEGYDIGVIIIFSTMDTNEVGGPILCLAVILTTFLWTMVYLVSWTVNPKKKAVWHCCVVLTTHVVVSPTLSYVFQVRVDPWPFEHPGKYGGRDK